MKSAAEVRREARRSSIKAGKPIPFPGWDKLRREETEDKPEDPPDGPGRGRPGRSPGDRAGRAGPPSDRLGPALSGDRADVAGIVPTRDLARRVGPLAVPGPSRSRWLRRGRCRRRRSPGRRPSSSSRWAWPRSLREGPRGPAGVPEEGRRAAAGHDGRGGGRPRTP